MHHELYKYCAFSENTLEIVSEEVIWVSEPDSLNDPFECSFNIEADMPLNEVIKRKEDVTKNNYIDMQIELIEGIKSEFISGGIFSLSEKRSTSLMWCHYANSHKGLCIGYGVSKNNDLGNGTCKKVKYGKYPSFSFTQMFKAFESADDKLARKIYELMVLSKDLNWGYEKEWRLLYNKQSNTLIKPDFSISSITFGMCMPASKRTIIKKLLEGKDINYFEAYKKKNSYDVGIKKHIAQ